MFGGWFLPAVLAGLSLFAVRGVCAGEAGKKASRKAILLVAFGTSVPEAQRAYDAVDRAVKNAFVGVEVRWAFTSSTIRTKLAKQGKHLDSPEMALVKMMGEGFSHIAALSLHVIPGIDFHHFHTNCRLFSQMAGGIERIAVARPLLTSHEDMVQVAASLIKRIPQGRKPGDAVLYVGHGSRKHPADALYAAMNCVFEQLDSNVFVATIGGYPSLEDLLPAIMERKTRKIYLIPFMTVAGDHARNDMTGDKPDSWRSIIMGKGIDCEAVLSGMAEYEEVVAVWLKHLQEAFAEL